MKSLLQSQQALHHALWGVKGHTALDSSTDWEGFVLQNQALLKPYQAYHRQLSLYESLLRNTVTEILNSFFPYCRHLLGEAWPELCEAYRRRYPNRSYQLYRCAENFSEFLACQEVWMKRFPFLAELALYEWLEVVVENAPEQQFPSDTQMIVPSNPDEMALATPVWNTASDLRLWSYPIPRLIEAMEIDLETDFADKAAWPETLAIMPQTVSLYIYRDTDTHRARFFELNTLTAQFIAISQANQNADYRTLFAELKNSIPMLMDISIDVLLLQGLSLLQTCHNAKILLASHPA
jgi:hypothetical protein